MMHNSRVEVLYTNTSSHCAGLTKQECISIQHSIGITLLNEAFQKLGLSIKVTERSFNRNHFGKPYITDGPHFNVAHSADIVIAAATLHGDIGVDIELIRNIEWLEYAKVFTPDEWQAITSSPNPSYSVLDLWVKKESMLKAEGVGLQTPFTDIKLDGACGIIKGQKKKLYLKNIPVRNYHCYLSTYSKEPMVSVHEIFV